MKSDTIIRRIIDRLNLKIEQDREDDGRIVRRPLTKIKSHLKNGKDSNP